MDKKSINFDGLLLGELLEKKPSKGEQKRLKIIGSALKSICDFGVSNSTFATVGQLAQMKPAHIAYYFPTREELILTAFKAVVLTAQAITAKKIAEALKPESQIEAIAMAAFEHIEKYPDHRAVLMALATESMIEKSCRELSILARETGFKRILSMVEQLGVSQKKQPNLARTLHCLISGFVLDAITRNLSGKELRNSERINIDSIRSYIKYAIEN